MQDILGESLKNLKRVKIRKSRMSAVLLVLSVIVSLNVFFALRQPGLTLAGDADCGMIEHSHDESCGSRTLICGFAEDGHVHDDACYETCLVIAQQDFVQEEASQPHVHGDDCYQTVITEPGVQTVLICENLDEGHVHDDACYETMQIMGYAESVLVCDRSEEAPAPQAAEETKILICDLAENLHVHDDSCYEWHVSCGLQEHIHSIECYSDETADAETPLDWQRMFAAYPYTGDLRRDLAGIARTQVGYTESARNFETGSDGIRCGYTRYGAWYCAPYGDWSAMFVSYCLNYAGADASEAPGNTGAASMAKSWDKLGKLALPGEYTPAAGDLVFFGNNTVGIVTEAFSTTFTAVCGDVDGAVRSISLPLADASIAGWGTTVGTVSAAPATPEPTAEPTVEPTIAPTAEPTVEPTIEPTVEPTAEPTVEPTADPTAEPTVEPTIEPTVAPTAEPTAAPTAEPTLEPAAELTVEPTAEITPEPTVEPEAEPVTQALPELLVAPAVEPPDAADLLDISNGPAVFIFAGGGDPMQMPMQRFSVRAARSVTELLPYLQANGGDYFFTLLDMNNQEPTDGNGNYIVQADTGYKLTISFASPEGFLPGTYQYQVPNGLLVDGGAGEFVLQDGTNVGSWTVTDEGLITMTFNEHMNSRTDITISATLGIHFPEQEEPIDFDGKISVTVEKPQQVLTPTRINKWGMQGNDEAEGQTDTGKIYWTVQILGQEGSSIPGNTVTDRILDGGDLGSHHYTQSDMDAGLNITVYDAETGNWFGWTVYPGDPNLSWTEDGWSYTMPESVDTWYGNVILGNEGWEYYIAYSSTPEFSDGGSVVGYMNHVEVDNQEQEAWTEFNHGDVQGVIRKDGSFAATAGGGAFQWEFQAVIPGRKADERAKYSWYIIDNMSLLDADGAEAGKVENDANQAIVTATYNGQTIVVSRIQDATPDDPFAWDNAYTETDPVTGVSYGRQIYLFCRCQCTDETCYFQKGADCWGYWYTRDDGTAVLTNEFCQCWTPTEDVTFTFSYQTDAGALVDQYGGIGYRVRNIAQLYYRQNGPDSTTLVTSDHHSETIPGMFQKTLTHDFDGYTAHYNITVNEAKLPLTNGAPLNIHDEMTETLAYISGSLVITSEDANGNRSTLKQDVDYTVSYDGTGGVTNEYGSPVHTLDIVILRPQPVMYILDYDTTLIIPSGAARAVKYSNVASVSLWGEDITDSSVEKVYADINIAAKSYRVEVHKTAADTGQSLAGATFGLYNAQGGLITTDVSDANGELHFETNIIQGIILREHVLYYMQELKAPPGYRLDDTKYWFCFCDDTGGECAACDQVMAGTDAFRIPFEQIKKVPIVNQLQSYDLPSTGGPGIYPLIYISAVFILTPLVYGFIRRRKREGRGYG